MDNLLPISTASASQTVFFTSTGVEKLLTTLGAVTIVGLALVGLGTILLKLFKNGRIKKL